MRAQPRASERVSELIQPRSGEKIVAQGVSPGSTMPERQAPKGRKNRLICQRVRQWQSHCLPVVAEGLIPLIYRRAFFKHRATPIVIAPNEEP